MQRLSAGEQAEVVVLLLYGIDVHPVAVEVAKATVLRTLPALLPDNATPIRIHLGDSLLTDEDYSALFGHREEAMRLVTPQGCDFFLPLSVVSQDSFPTAMRQLVLAAVRREPLPSSLLQHVEVAARQELEECRKVLEEAVQT